MSKANNCTFIIHPDGNDLNGGAFHHDYGGTDASMDDDPIVTIDGSTITCEIVDNYKLKPTGYTVVSSNVGNCLYGQAADGLVTNGDYEWHQTGPVSSVDTTNNYWVFDQIQTWGGTGATELQSGRLGGALATLGGLNEPTYERGRLGDGSVAYMKSGTYTLTSSGLVSGGRWQNDYDTTHLIAYKTTPGDHFDNPDDRVIIDTGSTASGGTVIKYDGNKVAFCTGIEVRANDTWVNAFSGLMSWVNCVAKEATTSGFGMNAKSLCFSCRAEGCGTSGFTGGRCVECVSIDSTTGFNNCPGAVRCVAHGGTNGYKFVNAGAAFACVADGCSAYGYTGGAYSLAGNCVAINSRWAVETTCAGPGIAFYNNTSNFDQTNAFGDDNLSRYRNQLQLTASPFTDAPNYDYTVNDDSGGGADLAERSPKFGAGASEGGPQQQQSGQLKSTGGGSTTVVTPGPVQIGM